MKHFSDIAVYLFLPVLAVALLHDVAIAKEVQPEVRRDDPEWVVNAGVMALFKPEYEGSDDYELTGWPFIDITYHDRIFFNMRKGFGVYVLDSGGRRLGISVGYRFGRDEDDSEDLRGLGDVNGGFTANLLAEWKIGNVSIDTRFEHQFSGDSTGFIIDLGGGYTFRISKKLSMMPSVRAAYASADYMDSYFSITNRQSMRSGLPSYEADAGLKSIGPRLLVLYSPYRDWSVQCMAAYERMLNDAGDSPVVKDTDQFRAGMGLSYRF